MCGDIDRTLGKPLSEHPGFWLVVECAVQIKPRLFLNCTKGDLRLPSRGNLGLCYGFSAQLVAIDSNRRLFRIVRNSTSVNIVVRL
jgi:hypothetical protein